MAAAATGVLSTTTAAEPPRPGEREGKFFLFVFFPPAVSPFNCSSSPSTFSSAGRASITLKSVLHIREAILVMTKGISNTTIIRSLDFTQMVVELVSNKRATRFDGVKIVER